VTEKKNLVKISAKWYCVQRSIGVALTGIGTLNRQGAGNSTDVYLLGSRCYDLVSSGKTSAQSTGVSPA